MGEGGRRPDEGPFVATNSNASKAASAVIVLALAGGEGRLYGALFNRFKPSTASLYVGANESAF